MGLFDFLRRPALTTDAAKPVKARDAGPMYGMVSPIANDVTGQGTTSDPINAPYFNLPRFLTRVQLECAYLGAGEVRRIVSALPADALAPGILLTDSTPDPEPLSAVMRATSFEAKVREAWEMARLYGEAFLFPILREHGLPVEDEDLRTPLDLRRVTGIERWEIVLGGIAREVTPMERQDRLTGTIPIGQPTVYRVMCPRAGVMLGPVEVHASRMIRFQGDRKPPQVLVVTPFYLQGESISVIQSALNALFNWFESGNSNRRAQQEVSQKVLKTSAIPAPDAPAEYLAAYNARWRAFGYGSSLGVTILDAGDGDADSGEDLSRLNFPVAGLAELDDGALTHLAAAIGWPKERLAGLQPSGIINSGSSWESAWYALVDAAREECLRAQVERGIEIMYAATGGAPAFWSFEFGELGTLTPKEKAEIEEIEARTQALYVEMGALSVGQIRRSKFGPEAVPPAGLQPATAEEMRQTVTPSPLPLAVRSDPVARAMASMDAADRVLVALEVDPASISALAVQVRRLLPDLAPESWPHVTLVYLGDGLPDRVMPAVRRAAGESGPWPASVAGEYVGPLGDEGAVVLYLRRLGLGAPAERLLRALAPYVRAAQFPRFVPHVTLGYLRRPLTDAEVAALESLGADVLTPSLVLRSGDAEIARWSTHVRP